MKILDDEKDKLMDHEYDGIRELDNHMPTWWLWLFYVTIAISVVYLFYYEVTGWGPDQHEQYEMEMAAAQEQYNLGEQEEKEQYNWTLIQNEQEIEEGKEMFLKQSQLCYTCHGKNAQGIVGPNLTDEYWLHGCSPGEIANSIMGGYPSKGMMPYGGGGELSNEEVEKVVGYIVSLRGTDPPNAKAPNLSRAKKCNPMEAADIETSE